MRIVPALDLFEVTWLASPHNILADVFLKTSPRSAQRSQKKNFSQSRKDAKNAKKEFFLCALGPLAPLRETAGTWFSVPSVVESESASPRAESKSQICLRDDKDPKGCLLPEDTA